MFATSTARKYLLQIGRELSDISSLFLYEPGLAAWTFPEESLAHLLLHPLPRHSLLVLLNLASQGHTVGLLADPAGPESGLFG